MLYHTRGILAQLGEHLPYKQNVSGSIPLAPTIFLPILPQYCNGPVVQLVRMPPCHGGGRGFEPHPGRLIEKCVERVSHDFLSEHCYGLSA